MAAVYPGLRRRRALQAPARQIAANASAEASMVAGKILDNKDATLGYNAQTGAHGHMIAMDIVDLVKVVRTGLQDATSVASLLVTTEAMIAEAPKKDSLAGIRWKAVGLMSAQALRL
ncbi:chaperonin GroEL (HSP60 family) [Mesorhizobium robiniae]|uniref:Chaperonin GroEL (HSP60 family) n=1 Tax=Mesorhizobium robiniae TaxID=559315 RepID=A0ABV2GWR8_9HYPH